jgi:hypothetical protein
MDECLAHLGALPVAMGPMAYHGRLDHGTVATDGRRARARTAVQVLLWRSFSGGVKM